MPTYDYFCQDCDHRFTEISTVANREEPTKSPCPACGKEQSIKILIGASHIGDVIALGVRKHPTEFKEVIQKIKSNVKHNTIPDY